MRGRTLKLSVDELKLVFSERDLSNAAKMPEMLSLVLRGGCGGRQEMEGWGAIFGASDCVDVEGLPQWS